jgi:hypothetical protein
MQHLAQPTSTIITGSGADSSSEYYDGPDRRQPTPESVVASVSRLTTEFQEFRKSVQAELQHQTSKLEMYMDHTNTLQNQMESNLQRQLDQNNEQHKEILYRSETNSERIADTFKNEMTTMIKMAERRFDEAEVSHTKATDAASKRMAAIELRLDTLEKEPDKKDANLWRKVRDVAVGVAATTVAVATLAWIVARADEYLDKIQNVPEPTATTGVKQ